MPGLPCPLTRTFWPSLMPAGMRTLIGEPPTLMVRVAPLRAWRKEMDSFARTVPPFSGVGAAYAGRDRAPKDEP